MKESLYLISSLIASLTNISIGLYVLYKNPDERINRIFALWSSALSMICVGDFFRKISLNPDSSLFWTKFMMVGVFFLMPSLIHFSLTLRPKNKILDSKFILYLIYSPSVLMISLLFGPYLISGVELVEWRYSVVWGPIMGPFGAIFGTFMLTGASILIKKVWELKQAKYLFASFMIIILFGLIMNFIPSIPWEFPTISPLAMFASLLFAYLAFKNKLVIFSLPESNLATDTKFELKAGYSYLVENEDIDSSFAIFEDFITHGYRGICISRVPPYRIIEKLNLKRTPVFWLSRLSGENNVHEVKDLINIVVSFLETGDENSIILLQGFEYLITHHGFLNSLKAIHFINDYIKKNEALMILPLLPQTFEEQQLKLVEAEMISINGIDQVLRA